MKKYLVILILIGLIGSLVAQMEFYNAYNLSNTYGPSDYLYSYQKNNHYYMTWSEWGSVYFSKSTNSGQDWTSASAVTPDDVIYFLPGVAAKDAMNVYISYSYGSPSNVFLRRSSTGGDSWYPEQNISNTTRMAQNPQVFAEGDTVLVIYEDRDINNKYQIVSVRSTDNGQTFSSPIAISSGNTTSRWPVFTYDNGVLYVVWTKEITDYNNVDLFFSKSSDYGQTWSTQQNITNDNPNGYSRYSLKAMNNKLFLVASSNVTASYNMNEIVFMKSDNGGDTWTTPINISNNEGNSSNPNLAVLSNNDGNYRLYLVWDDKIGTEETEVYLKYSTDNGNNWSETLNVTNSSFPSNKPKIFVENAQGYDDITLVWSEGLTSGGSDVFYKKGRHYLMAFATINGLVTDLQTSLPVAGATVTAGGFQAQTGADGHYSLNVSPGNYQVICTKAGYHIASVYNQTLTENQTLTLNFQLNPQTGENYPPHNLRGRFAANEYVALDWETPIGFNSSELAFDDGSAEAYNWVGMATGQEFVATCFNHEQSVYLRKIKALIHFDQVQNVDFYVFGDSFGEPDESNILGGPYQFSITETMSSPVWADLYCDIPVPAGNRFYIAVKWNQGNTFQIGSDLNNPDNRSFSTSNLGQTWFIHQERDFMIRAGISVPAETPDREVSGYKVYRNGTLITQNIINELSYQDDNVEPNQTYTYTVSAMYDNTESGQSNSVSVSIQPPVLLPPTHLNASVNNNDISLTWNKPGALGEWISYGNGVYLDNLMNPAPETQIAAIRFEMADLLSLTGHYVTKFAFIPTDSLCQYTIHIYTGGAMDFSGNLMLEQPLNHQDLVYGQWNIIDLTMPVLIQPNQELWIAYKVDIPLANLQPIAIDAGPVVATGKSDLLYRGGTWYWYYLDYNWSNNNMIKAFVAEANSLREIGYNSQNVRTPHAVNHIDRIQKAGNLMNIQNFRDDATAYRLYHNDELLVTTTADDTLYVHTNVQTATNRYYVTAMYGYFESDPSNSVTVNITASDDLNTIPSVTKLMPNYPNPFNPSTEISFTLKNAGKVRISIYNSKGQLIKILIDENLNQGLHSIDWNGKNESGKPCSSGIYFYKMETNNYQNVRKMLLMK